MPLLSELWLYSNEIKYIDNLKTLNQLISLNLSDNQISNIEPIAFLNNLKKVNLNKNQISDIKSIKNLELVEYLDLSSNNISDISVFLNFKNFDYLNLENNKINDIIYLKDLSINKLFIGENEIIDLTPLYYSLKSNKLGFINVNDSPNLLYPTEEIVKKGEDRIVEWFEMIISNCNEKIEKFNINKDTKLDLGMMGLTDLSLIPKLFELENLEELILSNHFAEYNKNGTYWERANSKNNIYSNNIYNIPEDIKKLKNLKKLIAGGDWKKNGKWNRWRIKDVFFY